MKKRIITIMVAAAALLALTASTATAAPVPASASVVLVRNGDGYKITGTLRDADSKVIGTINGTLIELTTGFNTCPDFEFDCLFGGNTPTCNLLDGEVTLNFQGLMYDAIPGFDVLGRVQSSLRKSPSDASTALLRLTLWSSSHVPPASFPDLFGVFATVQQISPTVWKSSP